VITVKNLRVSQTSNQRRLVVDLARPFTYTQHWLADPDRLVIKLKNAVLSRTAKAKIDDDSFPVEVEVTQVSRRSVRVVLDLEGITSVKLRKLTRPYRLVLDYVAQNGTSASTSQPMVVLPPVSRQITEAERLARLDIQTIVLDPGHGGKDPGARGPGGLTEKEVVLDVARRLRDLLQDRLGKKVLMTRDKDAFVELDDRAKFANGHKADLFVSIHINSHPRRATRGIEMYHFGIASDRRAMEVAARENGDTMDHARDFVDMIKADLAAVQTHRGIAESGVGDEAGRGESRRRPLFPGRSRRKDRAVLRPALHGHAQHPGRARLHQQPHRGAAPPAARIPPEKSPKGSFEGIRNYLNSVQCRPRPLTAPAGRAYF